MSKQSEDSNPPERAFRRCSDIRYRVVGGQAVIIAQKAGEAIVLNEVGTRVLELIEEGRSPEQIVTDLVSRFDADVDRIRLDLAGYLADLENAGVIEETPAAAEAGS